MKNKDFYLEYFKEKKETMKYEETTVEIVKEIEKFNDTKIIHRFNLLCFVYHVNLCKKIECKNFKFEMEYNNFPFNEQTAEKKVYYFQWFCRKKNMWNFTHFIYL